LSFAEITGSVAMNRAWYFNGGLGNTPYDKNMGKANQWILHGGRPINNIVLLTS